MAGFSKNLSAKLLRIFHSATTWRYRRGLRLPTNAYRPNGSAQRFLPGLYGSRRKIPGPCFGLMKVGNRGLNNIRWFTLFGLPECCHCVSICLSSLDSAVLIVRAFNKLSGSKA